jgi:hypothetical protein
MEDDSTEGTEGRSVSKVFKKENSLLESQEIDGLYTYCYRSIYKLIWGLGI